MMQNVIISIMVKQAFEDEEDEVLELVTQGTMEYDEPHYILSYEESEMTGLDGTTTTFFIEPHRIVLIRNGVVQSRMEFEQGKRHNSAYDTPYGSMEVEVHTRTLRHNITDKGGEILLEYNIEISKNIIGKNFFQIKVAFPKERNNNLL